MKSCILLLRAGHFLNQIVIDFCKSRLQLLAVANSDSIVEDDLVSYDPDFVISFLNDYILRGSLLRLPGINFHPAPPGYPGRGGASFALYDGASEFGATAHFMSIKVDTGPIIAVRRFPVSRQDNCEILFKRAELAAAELLFDVVDAIEQTDRMPEPSDERWLRAPITRAEFDAWLIVDPLQPEEMRRKIRAARHSRFPGPYVTIGEHRFAYDGSNSSGGQTRGKKP